jgi:hypothetical protein
MLGLTPFGWLRYLLHYYFGYIVFYLRPFHLRPLFQVGRKKGLGVLCLQKPTAGFYPEPAESNQDIYITF